MNEQQPLINSDYVLKKFPGKGGWTYAAIPQIKQNKSAPFGWVKVQGSIDGIELKQYKLMPMGNGKLFLPVKSAIRKQIKKEAGDYVHIVLSLDETPLIIPEEIVACFENEPHKVYENFLAFTEGERKSYLDWIYDAKTEETKADRIIKMIDRVNQKIKYHGKENSTLINRNQNQP